jgi:hypothetical protein
MKKYICTIDKQGHERSRRTEEAEPECGEDFCDACGDCLDCYGGDPCYESKSGEHFWVVYEYPDGLPEPPPITPNPKIQGECSRGLTLRRK